MLDVHPLRSRFVFGFSGNIIKMEEENRKHIHDSMNFMLISPAVDQRQTLDRHSEVMVVYVM